MLPDMSLKAVALAFIFSLKKVDMQMRPRLLFEWLQTVRLRSIVNRMARELIQGMTAAMQRAG